MVTGTHVDWQQLMTTARVTSVFPISNPTALFLLVSSVEIVARSSVCSDVPAGSRSVMVTKTFGKASGKHCAGNTMKMPDGDQNEGEEGSHWVKGSRRSGGRHCV